MTRILVTGSRNWADERFIHQQLHRVVGMNFDDWPMTIIHGGCPTGADAMASSFCRTDNFTEEVYPADWDKHGKAAGPIRNQEMVDSEPNICLAFLLPGSRGTVDCVERARKADINTLVFEYDGIS